MSARAKSGKRFNAKSTALEVVEGHNLSGKDAIVTGGASGIGVETVRALAKAGARVVIATRNLQQAQDVAQQLSKETGSNKIEAMKLDLASLKSVHEFVKNYLALNRPLHYLINNAGVMACPQTYTEDGFEMQIGTNHFGHFALTTGLIPALKEGAKQSGKNARVVNLSSVAHRYTNILFDDIHFKNGNYDRWIAYGQAKTANVLFSVGLTKRYAKDGIFSNAVMPGVIMTNLQRSMPKEEKIMYGMIDEAGNPLDNPNFKTVEQGASTTVWGVVAPELENRGGLYLQDCIISPIVDGKKENEQFLFVNAVEKYALDEQSADRLWAISEKAISK